MVNATTLYLRERSLTMAATMTKTFDFHAFVDEVFGPRQCDVFLILVDEPNRETDYNPAWRERHKLASEWSDNLADIANTVGFTLLPMLTFKAVSDSNAELPEKAIQVGETVTLRDELEKATVVIAMTEVSVTGPLMQIARKRGDASEFRVASMPLANRSMESTCLLADHRRMVERGNFLLDYLRGAETAVVEFTTGDVCEFDLRFRQAGADNGYLHADKQGEAFINLPSGEVWIVPYEGEIPGEKSRTEGVIPVYGDDGQIARFVVNENRVVEVEGDNQLTIDLREELALDPARRNVGEIAFGYNEAAVVSGLFIEDEKAGFHWGYGRSEFLGGTVGPESFRHPDTVLHRDLPYAKDCPITVSVALRYPSGKVAHIIESGEYLLWD